MRALILPAAALALSLISIAPAQAQSLDGTYRGTLKFTREVVHQSPGQGDTCARSGPIAFQVKDAVIMWRHPRAGLTFSAPVAGDGTFAIFGSYTGGGSGVLASGVKNELKGQITGAQLIGTHIGVGRNRTCYHSFTARRQGRG